LPNTEYQAMKKTTELPLSPISGSNKTRVADVFSSGDIVELYQAQEGINVKKYFRDEAIYLIECMDTGYRFFYPFETIGDEAFYREFLLKNIETGIDYDRDNSADHDFAKQKLAKDETLLEIGCSTGKFLETISDITKNTAGLELNSAAAQIAAEKGFNVFKQSIEDYADIKPESYDVVCAFQVLEHVAEVRPFLEACIKLLKEDGKLIFSVPNNEPFFQRFSKYEVLNLPPHHMGLWNLKSFENLCRFYNLKLIEHAYTGESTFRAEIYLRAKMMANIKSLPRRHSASEKLKIYALAPIAMILSSIDYLKGLRNNAHISVVFQKK
jgi:2-polyprenyl-3-methyl-5-hydroxy-6-metoxy-1,4-benzoquinol methylase